MKLSVHSPVARFLSLSLLLVLLQTGATHAQYSTSVFDLKKAQDLYDERGYQGASSISVDGKLVVSNGNGNVSYSYPISQSSVQGMPLRVGLNYAGSVQFTAFKEYNLADHGITEYDDNLNMTGVGWGGIYSGWSKFSVNRPAWILGVNGFAINVISTTTGHFHLSPNSSAFNTLATEFDDQDFNWVIDGYDFCNRMKDFGPVGGSNGDIVDVIRILREDGSVMELYNIHPRGTLPDTTKAFYTGYYTERGASNGAYAQVYYTNNNMNYGGNVSSVVNARAAGSHQAPLYPRRLSYYPGDGYEYVFGEYTVPYGLKPYFWEDENYSGGMWGGPSIFYLEEIRGNGKSIMKFQRGRHFNLSVPFLGFSNNDSTRGRAIINEFEGHSIRFGYNALVVEALGRTTKIVFDTILRSGPSSAGQYMPFAILGGWTPDADFYSQLPDSNDALYKSFVGYVTKIIDPEGRETRFDYQPVTRTYEDFGFPRSSESETISMTLKSYRLTSVREPSAQYRIVYTSPQTLTVTSGVPWGADTLNDVVDSLKKYTLAGSLLTSTWYDYSRNPSDHTIPTATQVTTRDEVTGHLKRTSCTFGVYQLPQIAVAMPRPRHTVVTSTTEEADSITTVSETDYEPAVNIAGLIPSPYVFLPIWQTTKVNGFYRNRQRMFYATDTVHTFNGDTALARYFGVGLKWKLVQHRRPDNVAVTMFTDSIAYRNYTMESQFADTSAHDTSFNYDKIAAISNFFYYRDSVHDARVVGKRWEDVMYLPPVRACLAHPLEYNEGYAPLYGVEQSVIRRADSAGPILTGKITNLRSAAPIGRPISDTIVGYNGQRLHGQTYWYSIAQDMIDPGPIRVVNALNASSYTGYGDYRAGVFSDPYCSGDPIGGIGTILADDNNSRPDTLKITPYSRAYGAPSAQMQEVRRTDSNGAVSSDSLYSYFERTYHGLTSASVDPNRNVSRYDYDRNGRLRTAWLPYDFSSTVYDTTSYAGNYEMEMYGMSAVQYRRDTLKCHADAPPDTAVGPATGWLYDQTLLRAERYVTTYPPCPCEAPEERAQQGGKDDEKKGDDRKLFESCNVWRFVNNYAPYEGMVGWLSVPIDTISPLARATSLDSAWIETMVSHVHGNCVNVEFSIPQFGFSRTYVFNCSGGGGYGTYSARRKEKGEERGLQGNGITAVPGGYRLQFDITPIRDSLLAMGVGQTIQAKVRVTTLGGSIEMVNGMVSEDERPHLKLKGSFRGFIATDYTIAYKHDDAALQTTVTAKTDDTLHSSTVWNDGFIRRSQVQHSFGADYRVLQSEALIGKPSSPLRRDTVRKNYSGGGLMLQTIDVEGDTVTTIYDNADRPVAVKNTDGTHTFSGQMFGVPADFGIGAQDFYGFCSVTYTCDELGRVNASYRDALDSLRKTVVDTAGLKLTTTYHYDILGRVDTVVNPAGQLTVYTYDPFGRVRTKTHPDLGTVSYAYDNVGNVRFTQTEEQANLDRLTFNEYDDLNRLVLVGEAFLESEGRWDTLYPPLGGGGMGTMTQPQGGAVSSEKSVGKRRLQSGTRWTDVLDPNLLHNSGVGPILTANATLWKLPQTVVPMVIPPSPVTWWRSMCTIFPSTELGEMGMLDTPAIAHRWWRWTIPTSAADPNEFENVAKHSQFPRIGIAYDSMPQRMGGVWMGFPSWGRWDSLAPTGKVRNGRGHEVAVAWRERHDQPYHYSVLSYDERGRVEALLRFTETIGFDAVYYRYNSLNEVVQVTTADPYHRHTVWYSTDWNGRIDSVWSLLERDKGLAPGGSVTPQFGSEQFCGLGLRPDSAELIYHYTRSGAVDSLTYARIGLVVDYAYNHRKWLDSLVAMRMGMPVFGERLSYDSAGQIVQQAWQQGMGMAQSQHYAYDKAGRLETWRMGDDTVSYSYDGVGNRQTETKERMMGFGNTESMYGYLPGTNRLLGRDIGPPGQPAQEMTLYTHDANGSLTGRRRNQMPNGWLLEQDSLSWSYRGLSDRYWSMRLPEPLVEWQYRYNAMGERESKRMVRRAGGDESVDSLLPWAYYLLGGGKEQRAVWHGRLHSQSSCGDTGRRVYFYPSEYLTPSLGWNGVLEDLNPLLTRPNGTREYRISDHLASVRVVLDQNGNPITTVDYDPWGNVIPMAGPVTGVRRTYNEQEFDRESGLGNLGVRRDDPTTGRFISIDPLWERQPGMTPYAYADLQPLNRTDPTGLQARYLMLQDPGSFAAGGASSGGGYAGIGGGGMGFGGVVVGGLGVGAAGGLLGTSLADLVSGHNSVGPSSINAPWLIRGVGIDGGLGYPTAVSVDGESSQDGVKIESDKQGKHIPGHRNYIPGRSPLTHGDPQGLLDGFAGTGQQIGDIPVGQPGSKERVDFGEAIGEVGGAVTTKGIIHYSKKGAHIVPANP